MKRITLVLFLFTSLNVTAQTTLKLYGGKNHKDFLGCITCDTEDPTSVWGTFSDYGSTHKAKSIWNENGAYGSKTSDCSPFNKRAKHPPLILDANGKSYGYLTINKKQPKTLPE